MPSLTKQQIRVISDDVVKYHREHSLSFFRKIFVKDSTRMNFYFTEGPKAIDSCDLTDNDKLIVIEPDQLKVELSSDKVHELKQLLGKKREVNPNSPSFEQVVQFTGQNIVADPTKALFGQLQQYAEIGLSLSPKIGKQTTHIAILDDGSTIVRAQAPVEHILSHTHEGEDGLPLKFSANGDDAHIEIEVTINKDGAFAVTDVKIPDLAQYKVTADSEDNTLEKHIFDARLEHESDADASQQAPGPAAELTSLDTSQATESTSAASDPSSGNTFAGVASFVGSCWSFITAADAPSPSATLSQSSPTFEDLGTVMHHVQGTQKSGPSGSGSVKV